MRNQAQAAGLNDVVVVNTCAVTAEAEKQARQEIRKIRRWKPEARIIATGCAVQIDPDSWASLPEIDNINGNQDKLTSTPWTDLSQSIADGQPAALKVSSIMEAEKVASHMLEGFDDHTRGFLQVQQGCDHRCTFCIIPYGRGNSRSVKPNNVVKQIKNLLEKNYKEVVLTGVDLTSYGHDFEDKKTITDLVKLIFSEVPNLKRLRLSSLDIAEIDDDLTNLIGTEKRILPHIHLSLQAGDNMILKRMKRRHLREDAINKINKIRSVRPDAVFGADLIAGFPTETEEMFNNTIKLVEECNISFLHVFPFSPREGTPASRMPQLNREIIKKRAKILRELGNEQILKYYNKLENTEMIN